mmetsp:Transcript_19636/g.47972  ORF Transcript_19636/g.47972 Transcript_19636/m.47972 type:complete len:253 (+) Transcript_19636:1117-1875(+)
MRARTFIPASSPAFIIARRWSAVQWVGTEITASTTGSSASVSQIFLMCSRLIATICSMEKRVRLPPAGNSTDRTPRPSSVSSGLWGYPAPLKYSSIGLSAETPRRFLSFSKACLGFRFTRDFAPLPKRRSPSSIATIAGVFLLEVSSTTMWKGLPFWTIPTLMKRLPKSIAMIAPSAGRTGARSTRRRAGRRTTRDGGILLNPCARAQGGSGRWGWGVVTVGGGGGCIELHHTPKMNGWIAKVEDTRWSVLW